MSGDQLLIDADICQAKLALAKQQRAHGQHTVPSTVREEKRINPFMRLPALEPDEVCVDVCVWYVCVAEVVANMHALCAHQAAAVERMARLRHQKNEFKPPHL